MISSKQAGELGFASRVLILNNPRLPLSRRTTVMIFQSWLSSVFHALAAVIDDVVEGFEDGVGEPVLPHEPPDIFLTIEFWCARRQWQQ
jgi:hypothetical protein